MAKVVKVKSTVTTTTKVVKVKSTITTAKESCEWEISDFASLVHAHGPSPEEVLRSPVFTLCGMPFYLSITFDQRSYMSVGLTWIFADEATEEEGPSETCFIKHRVTLRKPGIDREIDSRSSKKYNKWWSLSNVQQLEFHITPWLEAVPSPESILVHVNLSKIVTNIPTPRDYKKEYAQAVTEAVTDRAVAWRRAFQSPSSSAPHDITLVNISDRKQTLPAHRLVLCSHSPVFNSMLSSVYAFTESKTGECEINTETMSFETVTALVHFMYTGEAQIGSHESIMQLLKCAHQFRVMPLVNMCATWLAQTVTVDNLLGFLELASVYDGLEALTQACIDLVCSQPRGSCWNAIGKDPSVVLAAIRAEKKVGLGLKRPRES